MAKASTIHLRLDAADREALERLAVAQDRSISYLVRLAIREYIRTH